MPKVLSQDKGTLSFACQNQVLVGSTVYGSLDCTACSQETKQMTGAVRAGTPRARSTSPRNTRQPQTVKMFLSAGASCPGRGRAACVLLSRLLRKNSIPLVERTRRYCVCGILYDLPARVGTRPPAELTRECYREFMKMPDGIIIARRKLTNRFFEFVPARLESDQARFGLLATNFFLQNIQVFTCRTDRWPRLNNRLLYGTLKKNASINNRQFSGRHCRGPFVRPSNNTTGSTNSAVHFTARSHLFELSKCKNRSNDVKRDVRAERPIRTIFVTRTKLTCKVLELAPGCSPVPREVLELGGILAREGQLTKPPYVRTFQHQAIVRPSRLCAVTSRKER
ncbi:hypothetical protein EVAR_101016_1 [Eumeta japonica]|uniref:Uncharacterized protein n=1 Tax=Eumeta variegata TaxID=151549 RepID=A0A4C1SAD7_EUMVA|nr:hypothetical protein EVAR_101016_1 [Eumeta japonica]